MLYHLLVLLQVAGVSFDEVMAELGAPHRADGPAGKGGAERRA